MAYQRSHHKDCFDNKRERNMIAWKKLFDKQSLMVVILIAMVNVMGWMSQEMVGKGVADAWVVAFIVLSMLVNVLALIAMIRILFKAADSLRIHFRIMKGLLIMAFVSGVVIGLFLVLR